MGELGRKLTGEGLIDKDLLQSYDNYLAQYAEITAKTRERYARMVECMIAAVVEESHGPGNVPTGLCLKKEDIQPFFEQNRQLFEKYWKTKKYIRR